MVPLMDPNLFAFGRQQVIQILLQRHLVELRQKPDGGGRIQNANFFDQLTFAHKRFTFVFQ